MSHFNEPPAYPLSDHAAGKLQAGSGRPLSEITLEAVQNGELSPADLRIKAETLQAQAEIARQAGYAQLAANLMRAAELTNVPNEELLKMYDLLRPRRATFQELTTLAETLESRYHAPENGHFVREAAEVYQTRGLLRKED